jgi:hypothetical protein
MERAGTSSKLQERARFRQNSRSHTCKNEQEKRKNIDVK